MLPILSPFFPPPPGVRPLNLSNTLAAAANDASGYTLGTFTFGEEDPTRALIGFAFPFLKNGGGLVTGGSISGTTAPVRANTDNEVRTALLSCADSSGATGSMTFNCNVACWGAGGAVYSAANIDPVPESIITASGSTIVVDIAVPHEGLLLIGTHIHGNRTVAWEGATQIFRQAYSDGGTTLTCSVAYHLAGNDEGFQTHRVKRTADNGTLIAAAFRPLP